MLEMSRIELPPQGIGLWCRRTGPVGAPRVLLLHGFPEGGFIWEPLMAALAGQARVLAPDLRGFGQSDAPAAVAAYRPRVLVADLLALMAQTGGPVDLVVAHDWGGALAWNLAAQHPQWLRRLLIINSPHPAVFLQALRHDPAQQAASAYMNALCQPDMAQRLAADDFARLFAILSGMSPGALAPGGWLDEAMRQRYRELWSHGLDGALNWYRASPLRPPQSATDAVMTLTLPPEAVRVTLPTQVLWGEADTALPVGLLDGLAQHVPQLTVQRVPGASHWILHERPELVLAAVQQQLQQLG